MNQKKGDNPTQKLRLLNQIVPCAEKPGKVDSGADAGRLQKVGIIASKEDGWPGRIANRFAKKNAADDLQKLLDQNLSKTEIAQNLGVTNETVRYRTKQLKSKQKSIDPEIFNLETVTDRIDCKSALTLQEQIFLDLHLIEKKSIKDAMIQSGYIDLPERTIYFRAKKILQKYEAKTEDHRSIMRAIGAGEVAVISKMWEEVQTSQSAVARVQALTTLGKWLGLAKEVVEGAGGITIIFEAAVQAGQPISTLPPAQAQPISYQVTGKVLQITK